MRSGQLALGWGLPVSSLTAGREVSNQMHLTSAWLQLRQEQVSVRHCRLQSGCGIA